MFHKKRHLKYLWEWKISQYIYRLDGNHEAEGEVLRGVKY